MQIFKFSCLVCYSLAFIHVSSYAQVHKCPDGGGGLVIQQMPCKGTGKTVAEDLAAKRTEEAARIKSEQEKEARREMEAAAMRRSIYQKAAAEQAAADAMNKAAMDAAIKAEASRKAGFDKYCNGNYMSLRIGMTENQVEYCTEYVHPDKINQTETAQGVRKQYVFKYGPYLYFTNGILTAIQR